MTNELWLEMLPLLMSLAAIILTPLAVWLSLQMKQKLGIDVEAAKKLIEGSHRDALNLALQTAATLAVEKGLIGKQAADFMLDYLMRSSPEAAEASRIVLPEKIESALVKAGTDAAAALVLEYGGADKLKAALDLAKKWTPKD